MMLVVSVAVVEDVDVAVVAGLAFVAGEASVVVVAELNMVWSAVGQFETVAIAVAETAGATFPDSRPVVAVVVVSSAGFLVSKIGWLPDTNHEDACIAV